MTNPTQAYPIPTVGALIFNPAGEILLVQTHKWQNKFGLPGGKIEVGEAAEDALRREMREEVNLAISDIEFVMTQDIIFSEEFYKPVHFIFLNYRCRTQQPAEVVLNDEAQHFVWVSPGTALQSYNLNLPTRRLIEAII